VTDPVLSDRLSIPLARADRCRKGDCPGRRAHRRVRGIASAIEVRRPLCPEGAVGSAWCALSACIDRLAPAGSYAREASRHSSLRAHARAPSLIGVLRALRADVEAGWIDDLAALVHADTFAEQLDQADVLLASGYKDAAAVVAGIALETHLRILAGQAGLASEAATGSKKKADVINEPPFTSCANSGGQAHLTWVYVYTGVGACWGCRGRPLGWSCAGLADWLRSNRETKNRTREMRREAYTELLAAESHAFSEMNIAAVISKSRGVTMDQGLAQVLAGRAAQARLNAALAQVALVAPKDTRNAAATLMQISTDQVAVEQIDGPSIQKARDGFLRLAKRDLGIDSDGNLSAALGA